MMAGSGAMATVEMVEPEMAATMSKATIMAFMICK